MTSKTKGKTGTRTAALALAAVMLMPVLAVPSAQARTGNGQTSVVRAMTTKQKVVAVAGAALLYYLYKKHQAKQTQAVAGTPAGANSRQQLYRSKNGGVYYRDPRTHQPIWLTVPQQAVQIPAAELQRYAPDYRQYQGRPAPPVPTGYRTQPFGAFDPGATPLRGPGGPRM